MDAHRWGGWDASIRGRLDTIRRADRWRQSRPFDSHGPVGALSTGRDGHPRDVVSFASNDYLGLSIHPSVCNAATSAVAKWGTGSGASRLVVGTRTLHSELEAEVAAWKHAERAVLFPTGYAANLGLITALATVAGREHRPVVCSDELNHASIIDACRLAAADVAVYPHRDMTVLAARLEEAERAGRPTIVVSDSVFSMDGDVAPVDDLVELCNGAGALLVLDEAHAVLGPHVANTASDVSPTLLRMTTLSKTLGALGGVVAGPTDYMDLLVNTARPYIFSTASSPADTAAGLAALNVLRSPEGDALVSRLRHLVDRLRPGHPSPIVPIIVGSDRAALDLSAALLDRGLLVPAIRPPTVAEGTARLRVTLSAAHTNEQVDALLDALDELSVLDVVPS